MSLKKGTKPNGLIYVSKNKGILMNKKSGIEIFNDITSAIFVMLIFLGISYLMAYYHTESKKKEEHSECDRHITVSYVSGSVRG